MQTQFSNQYDKNWKVGEHPYQKGGRTKISKIVTVILIPDFIGMILLHTIAAKIFYKTFLRMKVCLFKQKVTL